MAQRIARPPAYRKRSTLELPPTDPTGLTLNIQPLQKRLTQQWLDYDAPFSLVREPEGLLQAEDDALRDIEDVHQKHWPSRSSSSDSENDISEGLKRLNLEDRYFRTKYPPFLDYGLPPGLASFGPPTDPSRTGGSRPGPSRQSSGRARGYSSSKAPGKGSGASGGVLGGRVAKSSGGPQVKVPRRAVAPVTTPLKPFGCPMVKASPGRYEAVDAPCTVLKGIKATSKALMEHLKKHHSRANRCMTCWKWYKNSADLAQHQAEPQHSWQRCEDCCKTFTVEDKYQQHLAIDCALDQSTKPELFSPEQQVKFRAMNRQIGKQGTIEEKYRWAFGELFPNHEERDTIWPWYDFAVFKHKLPQPPSVGDLEVFAGGLRLPESSDDSPSDESISPVSETPVEALLDVSAGPATIAYPEMGRQMHPAPGYNIDLHGGHMRRSSAPAHMHFLGLPQQVNYAYPPPTSSSIPSLPYLTEDGSAIASLAPRTPSLSRHQMEQFNVGLGSAGGFANQGMLSASNMPPPAIDYFAQPPQPEVLEDVSVPTGMRPVPAFTPDNFRYLYSEEFFDKHDAGNIPSTLPGYQQPGIVAGAYAQPPDHQQSFSADAAEADLTAAPHQWGQPYNQFPSSQG